jgi:hypothetical protein
VNVVHGCSKIQSELNDNSDALQWFANSLSIQSTDFNWVMSSLSCYGLLLACQPGYGTLRPSIIARLRLGP